MCGDALTLVSVAILSDPGTVAQAQENGNEISGYKTKILISMPEDKPATLSTSETPFLPWVSTPDGAVLSATFTEILADGTSGENFSFKAEQIGHRENAKNF